ncbi:MAG: hypothetical protein JW776_16825 [Candidatus Lokiarchaeota archaeon]|nr:hypothetical protein [Candidatus Lokiarchaeota archaeon]
MDKNNQDYLYLRKLGLSHEEIINRIKRYSNQGLTESDALKTLKTDEERIIEIHIEIEGLKVYFLKVLAEILEFQVIPNFRQEPIDLELYGINNQKLYEINSLPVLLAVLEEIKAENEKRIPAKYPDWNDYGYFPYHRNQAISKLLESRDWYVGRLKTYKKQGISIDFPFQSVKPTFFKIPDKIQNTNLISVMMPFREEFDPIFQEIMKVCENLSMECKRADQIFDNYIAIQDVFDLIYLARCIIVELTGKNPNVFYELGISHAFGKKVIPIIRKSGEKIPFDVQHHKAIEYEGDKMDDFREKLDKRLKIILSIA